MKTLSGEQIFWIILLLIFAVWIGYYINKDDDNAT